MIGRLTTILYMLKYQGMTVEEAVGQLKEIIEELKGRVNSAHNDTGIMNISKGEPYPFPY